jgi:small subunit ribosomal protein S1
MSESFAELFEESSKETLQKGQVVEAVILDINPNHGVTLDVGMKSEPIVSYEEFTGEEINVGDKVDVVIKSVVNAHGETTVSHADAKRARDWRELEKFHENDEIVQGVIIERVKGGFTVALGAVRAFLPGSLIDVKPVRDPSYLENKEIEFKIIKMDQKRNNVVVSRRAVMEAENNAERQARLEELSEGQEVSGIVKNITDYGAFLDLGGVDGLLHITDMAWKRVKHPGELINIGDELKVKVLRFDREKNRVSLGLKQLGEDPWVNIARRYPSESRIYGKVTNITDYGCFVEIEEGVEGLVHMSEMDWTNKNVHPSKVVKSGEEVEVMILEIDEDRRRISLGIKQCKQNPWGDFSERHEEGERVSGKIRSITDFGMFVGLDGGIDGLVHLSDISWKLTGEDAVRTYKKGDPVEAIILAIDPERERISLGIKQLETDPMAEYIEAHKDEVLTAKVIEVLPKHATVHLSETMTAVMKVGDYSHDRIKSLEDELHANDEVDVKILGIDRKTHQLMVSHKVLENKSSSGSHSVEDSPANTTLGDLLKQQMGDKSDD